MDWSGKTPSTVALPEIRDERGALGFVQTGLTCPFPIRRIYYMYDMTPGVERGAHAHHRCLRQLVAMAGAVEVRLEIATGTETHTLDSRRNSLLVPALAWITYRPLTPDAVLLALASEPYDESDYIRDYARFRELISR
jgi:hypothetical protein